MISGDIDGGEGADTISVLAGRVGGTIYAGDETDTITVAGGAVPGRRLAVGDETLSFAGGTVGLMSLPGRC